MITREQINNETAVIRKRIAEWGEPLSFTEFRLMVFTMVADGALSADWFLMVNSTHQLLVLEGLAR